MKVWVTLDGHDAEVEFTTLGERLVLEVEGRKLDADFVRLPDGRVWSLLVDGRSYEVCVVGEEGGLRVTWQNQTVPVEARHPLEKMLSQQGAARARPRARPSPRRCPARWSRFASGPAIRFTPARPWSCSRR